jgi:hypothetical protein
MSSRLETALRIGERLGVPVLVLVFMLIMLREAGTAIYTGAVQPLVKAHAAFLDRTQETLQGIEVTQRKQEENMSEIVAGQREITAILRANDGSN